MIAIARVKDQKGSPNKVRLVANLVRNKHITEARSILTFSKKGAAKMLLKILESAIANAVSKSGKVEVEKLYINKIFVDQGRTMKKYRPRARGMADLIRGRTCNITISVSDESPYKEEEITKEEKREKEEKKEVSKEKEVRKEKEDEVGSKDKS